MPKTAHLAVSFTAFLILLAPVLLIAFALGFFTLLVYLLAAAITSLGLIGPVSVLTSFKIGCVLFVGKWLWNWVRA